jgi:uncharacterized protein (DUF2141 family)
MEPPPGGPPDRTAPEVVSHVPAAGATEVPLDAGIEITFSENMSPASVEEALFISPVPAEEPELGWRGPRLRVRLKEDLRPDLTYVITLGVGCKDLRNNQMESSYSFAFSTGGDIDRGRIRGRVYRDLAPQGGADLWAYPLTAHEQPDPSVAAARYATQTDQSGRYQLDHLSPDRYRVFAVGDDNTDRLFQAGEEPLGVPGRDVDLAGEGDVMLDPFRLTMMDTTGPALLGVQVLSSRTVSLSFDEALDSVRAVQPGNYLLADVEGEGRALRIETVSQGWDRPETVELHTAKAMASDEYLVIAAGLTDRAGNHIGPGHDRARFESTIRPDTLAPGLLICWPADSVAGIAPGTRISLWFDEAVDRASVASAFLVSDSAGSPVSGQFQILHGGACEFVPDRPLDWGRWYTITLDGSEIADLAGNPMGDTTVVVHFSTMDEDLPGSISGRIRRSAHPPDATAMVRAFGAGGRPGEIREVTGEVYHLDHLPPGRYLVNAFLDLDGDRRWDPGRPVPFQPAEPYWVTPDTVTVRSRWETAGVDITFGP